MSEISSETLVHSIFQTLAYADVFEYPLTAGEVYRYLPLALYSSDDVTPALSTSALFSQVGDYFTLRGREALVTTRQRRAQTAAVLWPKALRFGRMIAALPFVRMVAVTGSLAVSNADANKDIDYMIVTAPGRLWTCRGLVLLIARLAKLDGVVLCPNYMMTTRALELRERSLYVAHELAQMVPIWGLDVYARLRHLNSWTNEYLPHAVNAPESQPGINPDDHPSSLQSILEIIFDLPGTGWLESWEMKRKIKRLTREQSLSSESYFSADVCKGHIDKHAEFVSTAFAARSQKTI